MFLEIVGIFLILTASFFPTTTSPTRPERHRIVTPERCQGCLPNPATSGCPTCRPR